MKKMIISIVCLLVFAAGVSSYAYYRSHVIVVKNSLVQVNVEALTSGEDHHCYSGGEGSSACSIDAGIEILGCGVSSACSVSCKDGYYACCGIGCRCIKE